jgi:hypothetical protein
MGAILPRRRADTVARLLSSRMMEKRAPTTTPPPPDTAAPPRNFTLSVDERLRAYAQGVPGHIRRRRRIEDLEARLVDKIATAEAPAEATSTPAFAADLALLNDLIGRHNRYYPIEANLPIDVRTGRLLDRGAPWRPLPSVTAADLVARAAGTR